MASVESDSTENNSVREIHKNGWLKGHPEKRHGPFSKPQKAEKVWVVFCIHDDIEPFLELYENRRSAYAHYPPCVHSLLQCLHISPTIAVDEDDYHEFAVTLGSTVVRLSAPTHEEMMEWIETLSSKLRDLGILQPKDNIYSKEPTSPIHFSTQNHHEHAFVLDQKSMIDYKCMLFLAGQYDNNDINHQASRDPNSPLPPVPLSALPVVLRHNIFNFDVPGRNGSLQTHSSPNSPTVYEALFLTNRAQRGSRRRSASEATDLEQTRSQRSTLSWVCPASPSPTLQSAVEASDATIPIEEGPPAYEHIVQRTPQVVSLKEMQAAALKKEMTHKGGVRIVLRKRDCVAGVAFVECFGTVWVAGWKQKDHPLLHSTFHIGDQVLSVAGKKVTLVCEVHKAIKHQPLMVEFIIQRLPYGKVFALKREFEGQDLGFVREGTTAEIREVYSNGLAARNGLPLKSATVDGRGSCNWMLTEVNNRPLNLCFKDNEVHERLNAVGRDISILVQPVELILELKRQLKNIRGCKEYLVQ